MKKYVAYYRVSTEQQGKSGLGLDAQRKSVTDFVGVNGTLVGEYTDIESGKKDNRLNLNLAIKACVNENAVLVVKEFSRISRGGYKVLLDLQESGVEYIECNSPHDSQLIKDIKFSFAKEEREKISERTKAALAEIRTKIERDGYYVTNSGRTITSLGGPLGFSKGPGEEAIKARTDAAMRDPNNVQAGVLITSLRDSGNSFYSITKTLNKAGLKTSRGNEFSEVQTKRLYNRFKQQ